MRQNLALVTRTIHGSTVLKNEEKLIFTYQGSSIWKKEAVGWKIIHLNESIQTNHIEELIFASEFIIKLKVTPAKRQSKINLWFTA